MKRIFLYISLLIAGASFNSCSDLLDTETLSTDNRNYLCSNPTDARKMINHVYAYFCEDTYTSRMGTNWMQNTDVEIGFVKKAQASETTRRGLWALNPAYFGDIKNCWNNTQQAIDFANQCIEGIEASDMYKNGDTDMKQIHGEALCLRAYWYFLMCNFWGDVPFATTPTSKDDMHNDPRTDKNIIYTHLIQDLINCEGEMQWSEKTTVEHMNREFALGFIAKLAMFRAGYSMQKDGTMARSTGTGDEYTVHYVDENGNEATATSADDYYKVARAYAKKLISLKDRQLNNNYKQIFVNEINSCNPANGDVLFELGYVPNSGGDIGWCLGLSVVSSSKGSGTTYTNLTPSYACSFNKEDQRLAATCANYRYLYDNKENATDGWGIQPAKWCRMDLSATNIESKGTGINFPILRYADVLLLLAEADNEINNGPTAEAKEMLKRVRSRAFAHADNKTEMVDGYINALNSYDDFKKAIINERAWEFGGEMIRKFDLIRWNYYSDAIVNTIEWIRKMAINYNQLEEQSDGSLLNNKDKEIEDLGVAPRLYFNYVDGKVKFENDYFTYRDRSVSPYKEATTLKDDDIKNANMTFDGLKYINFLDSYVSVSDTDPTTNKKYGKDEEGKDIKKGVLNEQLLYSWFGLTDGTITTGLENLTPLRKKVTPYIIPIPKDNISSSNGVLSNDGYAIRNK